jgi:hypothetical protein
VNHCCEFDRSEVFHGSVIEVSDGETVSVRELAGIFGGAVRV